MVFPRKSHNFTLFGLITSFFLTHYCIKKIVFTAISLFRYIVHKNDIELKVKHNLKHKFFCSWLHSLPKASPSPLHPQHASETTLFCFNKWTCVFFNIFWYTSFWRGIFPWETWVAIPLETELPLSCSEPRACSQISVYYQICTFIKTCTYCIYT